MRILQLGKFFPLKGGVEMVMYALAEGFSKRKIECDILFASGDGQTETIEVNEFCKIFLSHTWFQARATMISPSMITKLRKICKHYDIIQVHHPDPMAALALWFSGFKGKVVLHWHSDIVRQNQLLRMYKPLQSWLIKRADVIVGTSPVYIKNSLALASVQEKTTYIPIGVYETEALTHKTEEILKEYKGKHIIFSLGRLISYKGFDYLIDAAHHLNDDYIILIGGCGNQHFHLRKKIESEGLQDKVYLLGYISNQFLGAYFEACTVFCLTSVDKREAFAIVQVKAMSHGKPVIATDIPESGVPWVNKHGVSGLNVPPKDSLALVNAIKKICEDKTAYNHFCQEARKRYETLFLMEKMIDAYHNLYKKILDI